MISILTIYSIIILLVILFIIEFSKKKMYEKRLKKQIICRIHVNGIRGKSSATRLIAAVVREKYNTIAKTTGTSARVIVDSQEEYVVKRKEANISEQKSIIKKILKLKKINALVFECMAINPLYQRYLEKKIMHSTISVLTNVRTDHTEQLGNTLEEIAKSLSNTLPNNGIFITSEDNSETLKVLKRECSKKNVPMIVASKENVSDEEMKNFKHIEFKENVSLALEIAKSLEISREKALQAMYKVLPDPGAIQLIPFQKNYFINLMAVNDPESFVISYEEAMKKIDHFQHKKVILLNNRFDRGERIDQFIDVGMNHLNVDYIVALGDFGELVKQKVAKRECNFLNLSNNTRFKDSSGEKIITEICSRIQEPFVLIGAVNIHTHQAERILEYLRKL